eukprot:4120390-Prymnesium_polylepis.1
MFSSGLAEALMALQVQRADLVNQGMSSANFLVGVINLAAFCYVLGKCDLAHAPRRASAASLSHAPSLSFSLTHACSPRHRSASWRLPARLPLCFRAVTAGGHSTSGSSSRSSLWR